MLKIETFGKVYQKYRKSFEIWCWKRMKRISCAHHVRHEEVLKRDGGRKRISYKQ
jgi:hypothetical protein